MDASEFKNCVDVFVTLHDEIARATKQLGELRKKKEAVGKLVVEFMKQRGLDECELTEHGGKLVRRESKRTETLKKDHIMAELLPLLSQDKDRAESVLKSIYERRNVETSVALTRVQARQPRSGTGE
jgi:hypothetical protein